MSRPLSTAAEPANTPTIQESPSRFQRLMAEYRRDHRHPVNHFLHVGVGWPIAALAVITFPFRPLWGVGLLALAYAIMFTGHFLFEGNIPTILKHPSTPFVVAANVIRSMLGGATRLLLPRK